MGDWRLEALLGRGAMGEVWRARRGDGPPVALKLLVAGEHASPETLARFEREARAAAALDHPGVVRVLETGRVDERVRWIALELVEGESLAARLVRGRPPVAESLRIALELAQALEAAHARGVVHRDLKPGNVLLDATGRARLTDFGLAKLEREQGLTAPGTLLGTPGYMAPEQAFGAPEEVGPRADVYGLGAVLYELLTGRPPHVAATSMAVLRKLEEEAPAPPSSVGRDVPPALDAVVLRALEKDPARRTPDARALRDDLLAALAGAPTVPPGTLAPRPAARRPGGRALLALALLLLAGAVATVARRDPLAAAREGLARAAAAPPAARKEPVEAALLALRAAGPAADGPEGLALAEALERSLGRFGAAARALEGSPPGAASWRRARDLLAAAPHQLACPGLRRPELRAALARAAAELLPPEQPALAGLVSALDAAARPDENGDPGARAEERLDVAAAAGLAEREVLLGRARARLTCLFQGEEDDLAGRARALEVALARLTPLRAGEDPSEVHALEAAAHLALGAHEPAREAADRLLAEAPAAAGTYLLRGLLHQDAGRWVEARADLELARRLDPASDAGFLLAALEAREVLATRAGVAGEATWQAQLLAAVGEDPRPQAHLLRALVAALRTEWDEAERHLRATAAAGGAPEVDWVEDLQDGLASRGHLLGAACRLLARCDQEEDAFEAAEAALAALATWPEPDEVRHLQADARLVLARLLEDEPDAAARHLVAAIQAGADPGELREDEQLAPLLGREEVRAALERRE